ncbi:hypothetical protein [Dyella caseinilytica]|uniref:Tail tube protein n=1 Tax=Dyella caseinilytica TaxID=1849581 RepID=A0ABX7GXP6_9GAMM|nr:hypothetical protein [Dyella caseinilytica]QRN55256.1 hypothetical protein ISN74_07975 [Dyella caseinilytica]GGA00482.1 hypothetical protein GCM10011408_21740 [Dyella caseinilytica]
MATWVPQGVLNRLRCNIVVSNNLALNITAPYMGKNLARIAFSGKFVTKEPTATGYVNSPEPYVMASISVELLRPQVLSAAWIAQAQLYGDIGPVTIYSDASTFPALTAYETSIGDIDPGAFNGMDPVVRLTLEGKFPANSQLWNMA